MFNETHSRLVVLPLATAVALALLLLPALPALAADIEVNAACSLENAVASANTNTATGGCAAGSATEVDVITLTGDVAIAVDNHLSITTSMTINGGGHTVTASPTDRQHFRISDASATLTLNNLVLTGGTDDRGGSILVDRGNLNVNDSVFHGNHAWTHGGAIQVSRGNVRIHRSVFYNNTTDNRASAIGLTDRDGHLTVTNSAFYNNRGIGNRAIGSAIIMADIGNNSGGNVSLDHVTIVGNSSNDANRSGGLSTMTSGTLSQRTFKLRNSIIYGNTAAGANADCTLHWSLRANDVVTNNIIGAGSASCLANQLTGDANNPLLPDLAGGASLIHLVPGAGSPAIDAAVCLTVVTTDLRGRPRRLGASCDIGAYETTPPPGDGTASGGPRPVSVSPTETCQSLAPAIAVSNANAGTACQLVQPAGYGHPDLVAAMPASVVDVWGQVMPNTQVCFMGTAGALHYVDTTTMQRTVTSLSTYSKDGMLCATIDGPGQVALIADGSAPGGSAPALTQAAEQAGQPVAAQSLSGCMVRTQYTLNFRQSPAGERLAFTDPWGNANAGWLPAGVTLTALERTADWFRVDYHGTQGWISAAYVTPIGTCGG